ncbi:hypothetical protein D1007_45213 [Hordeum vulgare]|nr:hypothetical protein D1007_45213 [Hordeum vulgare]
MSSELPLLQLGAASPRMPLVTPTATGPACSTKTSRCFSLHRAHLRHHRRRPTFIPLLNRGSKRDEALILEEVSKYNSKDGCWLIIVGKVYPHIFSPTGLPDCFLALLSCQDSYFVLHDCFLTLLSCHDSVFLSFSRRVAILVACSTTCPCQFAKTSGKEIDTCWLRVGQLVAMKVH